MPANTPRPIGKTCNFFPGIWKGVEEELADEFSAAAVPDCTVPAAEFVAINVEVIPPIAATGVPVWLDASVTLVTGKEVGDADGVNAMEEMG